MAERSFSTTHDHQSPQNEMICTYKSSQYGGNWSYVSRSSRGNGVKQVVSGTKGGKFSPGDLKLRAFTAAKTTYQSGEISARGARTMIGAGQVKWRQPYQWSGRVTGSTTLDRMASRLPKNLPMVWDQQLADFTTNRALAKLSKPDEDVGAFLGELPQTLAMFIKWASSYRKALKSAREGGFTWERARRAWSLLKDGERLKRLPRFLSDSWLTWRYGIRPLFWDAQMFMKIAAERDKLSRAHGMRRKVSRSSRTYSGVTAGPRINIFPDLYYDTRISWNHTVKCETTVYYQILSEASDLEWIFRKYGLHHTQIPALLWELTPLSFVVDWFVDVQSWITALQPTLDEKLIGWSTSCRVDSNLIAVPVGGLRYGAANWTEPPEGDAPHDQRQYESIKRKVGTTFPGSLKPVVRPNIALSIPKWVDLASLALQRCMPNRRSH